MSLRHTGTQASLCSTSVCCCFSLYSFDPRIRVFPNGTIAVQSVTERDAGDYLCLARNKMGDDYVQLRVDVLMRPAKIEQKQPRSQQEVVYGGDLTVDCVASGLPPPQISWALPDGTMVNPGLSKDAARSGQSRRYEPFKKASRKSKMLVLLHPQRNNPGYHFQVWGV